MGYKAIMFSGGASRGFMFLGAIKKLVENKKIDLDEIQVFGGISIGTVFAFLFCLDYKLEQLEEFLLNVDLRKASEEPDIFNLLEFYGVIKGDKLVHVLRYICNERFDKSDVTFKELFDLTGKKLIIQATNISISKLETFSLQHTPDMSVSIAIRMSISLPLIFTPVLYNNNYYVDPGINTHVPLLRDDIFLEIENSEVLFITIEYNQNCFNEITNIFDFFSALMKSYFYGFRTIKPPTDMIILKSNCETIFPNYDEKVELIKNGYEQVTE